ncbi:aminodeoxychorismate synthase component I [Alcaligenaceae bacterium CGII-47]|nr:aminodeoxychorismate synthase component I [Alcaligenaceae bacterium CGII-47]
MSCRFEDRLAGRALVLESLVERIAVTHRDALDEAFRRIEAAQQAGHWVALILNYELGEWLEPQLCQDIADPQPRLTALIYARAQHSTPWAVSPQSCVLQVQPRTEPERYQRDLQILHTGIAAGAYYQVNYTVALDLSFAPPPPGPGSAASLYRTLAARHPVAHAAYIEDGTRQILSFSPELFVARQDDTLTVRPMKGTAPRLDDPHADEQAGQTLLHSAKNRAENLMIVDLLRNDLGRLASPGSVEVKELFTLEKYPSVWTLTSTIQAQAPEASLRDILNALFPCGSVTGAPKIAAMQAIRTLEARPRGIYCGSVGWLAPDGDFSLNVAIRTIEINRGNMTFGVGGGITYDSDASEEWEECLWKARVLNPV